MREKILAYAIRYQGDWQKIARAIQQNEEGEVFDFPYPYVTLVDEAYPQRLKKLRFPP